MFMLKWNHTDARSGEDLEDYASTLHIRKMRSKEVQ